jgi:hypothetical protein
MVTAGPPWLSGAVRGHIGRSGAELEGGTVAGVVLVAAVAAAHFAFIAYLAVGGFLAWRWPRLLAWHVGAVAWGCATIGFALPCPLTTVEDLLRTRYGLPPLGAGGFAGHYLTYPAGPVRALFATLVLVSWAALWLRRAGPVRGGGRVLFRMSR